MNVLQQIEKDLGLVMDEPHGDSVRVYLLKDGAQPEVALPCKFDEAYLPVNASSHADLSSSAPTVLLQESAVLLALGRKLSRRDRLRVNGRLFKPEEFKPDGLGLLLIRLQEL